MPVSDIKEGIEAATLTLAQMSGTGKPQIIIFTSQPFTGKPFHIEL